MSKASTHGSPALSEPLDLKTYLTELETAQTEGFEPSPSDYTPPEMNPAPLPESAEVDPWGFLELEAVDIDTENGPALLALNVWQIQWGLGELKRRIEELERERGA